MGKELNSDFHALVEREMQSLGFIPAGWNGTQLKYRTADDATLREVGIANLRKRVKLHDPAEAPALVREFLKGITAVASPEWKLPDSLTECEDRLLPRLGKPFAAEVTAPWSMPLAGTELVQNLVIDFPTTMAYVTTEMMEKSGRTGEAWLARAFENLKVITKPDWLETMNSDSGIVCCHTNDSYDAARALLLCELTGNDPSGWLVAVPARDWLFARKVELQALPHLHQLKIVAEKAYGEQPYAISDRVFWVRPGQSWQTFDMTVSDKEVTVRPSEEFIEVLNSLSGETPPEE